MQPWRQLLQLLWACLGGCGASLPCAPAASPRCSQQLEGEAEVAKLEALQWVNALLGRDARLVQEQQQLLLATLCDALSAASGELPPAPCRA
jgi:hypothetical protein